VNPSVSVITPVYNCERFIGETIHSVLQQHYPNLEYIVLDDGSTDRTGEIIQSRFRGYPLHYERHDNCGEAKTVNRGFAMAQGEYVMVVNADDPLLPSAISHLVDVMEAHRDVLAAYPDWDIITEDGRLRAHQCNGDYDFVRMVAYHKCLPSVGTMIRRKVIDLGFLRDTRFRYVGDYDFWLRLGLCGAMKHVPERLASWRYSSGQLSNERGNLMAAEHVVLIDRFFDLPNIPSAVQAVKGTAFFWANTVAAYLAKDGMRLYYLRQLLTGLPSQLIRPGTYSALYNHTKYISSR